MKTKMPDELRYGDQIAFEGGGYIKVLSAEVVSVPIMVGGVMVPIPAVRVHLNGGRSQLADPRTPVELA